MSHRILWVEEEIHTTRWERLSIEAQDSTVVVVRTVAEGLEALQREAFDAVIADLILPPDQYSLLRGVVDPRAGVELVQQIRDPSREGATRHDVKLVVLSAVISPELKAEVLGCLDSPADYLDKPVDEAAFTAAMRRMGLMKNGADTTRQC